MTLTFPWSPIARQFEAGDRVRVAVTLRATPDAPLEPLTVYTGDADTFWVELPFATKDSGN